MARWGEGVRCGKPRPARRVGGSLMVMTRHTRCVVTVPAAGSSPRRPGRLRRSIHAIQIGSSVDMAPPRLRELIALSLLAGLGFGLAFARGDVIFVGVFGAACAMAIIGGTQRFP